MTTTMPTHSPVTLPGASHERGDEFEGMTFPTMLLAVLDRRRLVLVITAASIAIALTLALLRPSLFASVATFTAGSRRSTPNANLGGIAAQLGIGSVLDAGGPNAQFYGDVVGSRRVMTQVVRHEYRVGTDTGVVVGPLNRVLGRGEGATAEEETFRDLREMFNVNVSPRTGLVTVKVTTEWPELSMQIAEQFLQGIEQFNTENRQSQAAAERTFVEGRVATAVSELRDAESKLAEHLRQNRDVSGSPTLQVNRDRLERDVGLKQQFYISLVSAYEQARIEQLRDTPVLTIVDRPALPIRREPKGRLRTMVSGLLLGIFFSTGVAVGLAWLERSGTLRQPDWLAVRAALRRPTRGGAQS